MGQVVRIDSLFDFWNQITILKNIVAYAVCTSKYHGFNTAHNSTPLSSTGPMCIWPTDWTADHEKLKSDHHGMFHSYGLCHTKFGFGGLVYRINPSFDSFDF